MKIEDHFDDCGEDLSSLKGVELCSLAWTSSLDEEAEPCMSETAYARECDGISKFMFYGPCDTPDMKHLSMVVLPNITTLKEMCALKHTHIFLADLGGGEARNSRLSVRGKSTTSSILDARVKVDLTVQSSRNQLISFLADAQASAVVLTPAPYTQIEGNPWEYWSEPNLGEEQYFTQVCGHIAAQQLNKCLHFLLYQANVNNQKVLPWPQILTDDRVGQFQYSRCSCGLQETGRSDDSPHVSKHC